MKINGRLLFYFLIEDLAAEFNLIFHRIEQNRNSLRLNLKSSHLFGTKNILTKNRIIISNSFSFIYPTSEMISKSIQIGSSKRDVNFTNISHCGHFYREDYSSTLYRFNSIVIYGCQGLIKLFDWTILVIWVIWKRCVDRTWKIMYGGVVPWRISNLGNGLRVRLKIHVLLVLCYT